MFRQQVPPAWRGAPSSTIGCFSSDTLDPQPGHFVIALREPKESRGSVKMGSSLNQQIWCPTEWICTTTGLSLWTSLLMPTDFSPFLLREAGFGFIPTAWLHNCSHKQAHTRQLAVPVWQSCAWSHLLAFCLVYVLYVFSWPKKHNTGKSEWNLNSNWKYVLSLLHHLSHAPTDDICGDRKREGRLFFVGLEWWEENSEGWWINE